FTRCRDSRVRFLPPPVFRAQVLLIPEFSFCKPVRLIRILPGTQSTRRVSSISGGFRPLDSRSAPSLTRLTAGWHCFRLRSIHKDPQTMPTTDAIGEQVIEAVVAGPDGANRLFTINGAANVCIEATRQQRTTETWTFLVGPPLTRLQFHRAIGTASIASQIVSIQTTPREFTVNIHSVEADW